MDDLLIETLGGLLLKSDRVDRLHVCIKSALVVLIDLKNLILLLNCTALVASYDGQRSIIIHECVDV